MGKKNKGKKQRLKESVTDSVFGQPIPFEQIYSYMGQPLTPLFYRELYQSKPVTLRTLQQIDRSRQLARYAYETNENAIAVVNGMRAYVIGGGYDVQVATLEDEDTDELEVEVLAAQAVLNEFIAVNDLREAQDGCPAYDEAFTRSHVEGEFFLELIVDEEEPCRVEFVEPDNIRPPVGQSWEGPWSFGVLTAGNPAEAGYTDVASLHTSEPVAYNINHPLTCEDRVVEARYIHHFKLNVKKNQKRGISSLYPSDETLRGTQKLRYAAREGAKVRASIPYVREHAQADKASVQALQDSVITQQVPRSDGQGQTYDVPVQQIEPGQVADVPASLVMKPTPPDPNAEGVEQNLRHGIETVAARFNCPPWLVGGTTGDSSYADGLVKESPFYKVLVKQQSLQTGYWARLFRAVLMVAEEQGRLPEGVVQRLRVVVTAEDPQVRNEAERTQTNMMLVQIGALSMRTLVAESGHDPDEERARVEKERAEGLLPTPGEETGGGKDPETTGGQRQRDQREQWQEGSSDSLVVRTLTEPSFLWTWHEPSGELGVRYAPGGHSLDTHESAFGSDWMGAATHRGRLHEKSGMTYIEDLDNDNELTDPPPRLKAALKKKFPNVRFASSSLQIAGSKRRKRPRPGTSEPLPAEEQFQESGLLGHEVLNTDTHPMDDNELEEHKYYHIRAAYKKNDIISSSPETNEARHTAAATAEASEAHHMIAAAVSQYLTNKSSMASVLHYVKGKDKQLVAAGHLVYDNSSNEAHLTSLGSTSIHAGAAILSSMKQEAKKRGAKRLVGEPTADRHEYYKWMGATEDSNDPDTYYFNLNEQELDLLESGLLGHEVHDEEMTKDELVKLSEYHRSKWFNDDENPLETDERIHAHGCIYRALDDHIEDRNFGRKKIHHLIYVNDSPDDEGNPRLLAAASLYHSPEHPNEANIASVGSLAPMAGFAVIQKLKDKAKKLGVERLYGEPVHSKVKYYEWLGAKKSKVRGDAQRYYFDIGKQVAPEEGEKE